MHPEKGELCDLLLVLSGLFIPINIYVIGNWMGAGVQFALFRVQISTQIATVWSYISLFRDIQFVAGGFLTGRTGLGILFWTVSATVLAFATFLYLFQEDIGTPGRDICWVSPRRFIGLSVFGSTVLFLFSMIAQYGPFFHGTSGFAIPVGLPVMLYTGYYFYRGPSGSSTMPREGGGPVRGSWRSHRRRSRTIFALVCFFAIFLTLNYILYVYPDSGGDFGTYCSAVDLWNHQESPYNRESISLTKLQYLSFGKQAIDSFFYPPATLLFFAPICGGLHLVYPFKIYFPVYLLVFFLGCLVANRFLLPEKDRLLLYTLLTAGFASLCWSFSTGNISILYFLFIPLVFYFLIKKQYYASSLWIALTSIFNIFPIVFSTLYVFSPESRKKKLKIIAFSLITLAISLGISYLAYPALFNSYAMQFLGESTPVLEPGGLKNPAAYPFFRDLAGLFREGDTAIPNVLDFLFIGSVLTIFYSFYRKNRSDHLKLFSFGLMSIFLLIPRLKPNYFIFILVPIYLIIIHEKDMIKTLIVTIGAVIPFICLVVADRMPVENLTKDLVSLLISYNQLLCALAVFIVIAWLQVRNRTWRGSHER